MRSRNKIDSQTYTVLTMDCCSCTLLHLDSRSKTVQSLDSCMYNVKPSSIRETLIKHQTPGQNIAASILFWQILPYSLISICPTEGILSETADCGVCHFLDPCYSLQCFCCSVQSVAVLLCNVVEYSSDQCSALLFRSMKCSTVPVNGVQYCSSSYSSVLFWSMKLSNVLVIVVQCCSGPWSTLLFRSI